LGNNGYVRKKMIPCGNGQQFANWKSSCFKNGKSSNQMIYHTGSCLKSPEPLHIPVLANEGCYTTWLIGGLELIITTNALLYLACHHKSNWICWKIIVNHVPKLFSHWNRMHLPAPRETQLETSEWPVGYIMDLCGCHVHIPRNIMACMAKKWPSCECE
jgi:hypothetical protein